MLERRLSVAIFEFIFSGLPSALDACQITISYTDIAEMTSPGLIQNMTPFLLISCDKPQIGNTSKYSGCNELHGVVTPLANYQKVPFHLCSIFSDGMTHSATHYRDIFMRDKDKIK